MLGARPRRRGAADAATLEVRRLQVRAVTLATVAMFASAPGQSFLIAVFVDEMLAGAGVGRTAFAGLYAAGTVVSATAMLVLGAVSDRVGLRVVWAVVALGLAGACMLASLASGIVVVFAALALLRTFGQGSFPLLSTLLVAPAFRRRRGRAMAIARLSATAAAVVLPPAAAGLILAIGWRAAWQVLAAALVVFVLPLAALVHRSAGRRSGTGEDPHGGAPGRSPALRTSRVLPRFRRPTGHAARLLVVLAAPPLISTAIVFHAVSVLGQRGLSQARRRGPGRPPRPHE